MDPVFDYFPESCEPGGAVGIGQGNAPLHLVDAGSGVKIIGVGELPAELCREQLTDGGFAGTGNSHEQNDHRDVFNDKVSICPEVS